MRRKRRASRRRRRKEYRSSFPFSGYSRVLLAREPELQFEVDPLVIIGLKNMTLPVISGDGAEAQPSVPAAESVAISAEQKAEDELDAKVRESLGDHYVPLDGENPSPDTTDPEKPKEESQAPKPDEESKPAPAQGQSGDIPENVETPPIRTPEPQASRLDKRVATLYVQNLLLSGEKDVPSIDELVEELRGYPMEQKIDALHHHRLRNKELKGIKPTGKEELDPEDSEAIRDAERESIRAEIRAEEHERQVKQSFVAFINAHPELDESKKEHYQPNLARAVETLWRGGMPIEEALETVNASLELVKETVQKTEQSEKQRAFSGSVSASGHASPSKGELTWEDMARLQTEDPEEYERLIKSGYTPKS